MKSDFASGNFQAALSHCFRQVRTYDYCHHLGLLELPPHMRKAALALGAFIVNISRAMDVSAGPIIGLMLLLLWQEATAKIFSNGLIVKTTAKHSLQSYTSVNSAKMAKFTIETPRENQPAFQKLSMNSSNMPKNTASTILFPILQAGGIELTAAENAGSHIPKESGLLLLLIKSLPCHASINQHSVRSSDNSQKAWFTW